MKKIHDTSYLENVSTLVQVAGRAELISDSLDALHQWNPVCTKGRPKDK